MNNMEERGMEPGSKGQILSFFFAAAEKNLYMDEY
jgi:hypothetical protein